MKVIIIPIVIGAFGTVTKGLLKGLEDLEIGGRVETIQTTALLKTARILRRVLKTWWDLLSLNLQWKTIRCRWCEKLEWVIIIIIINCNWWARYSHQRFGIKTGGLVNERTSGDHSNDSIVEIGQNTEKIPEDLKRLAVTQTSVKDYQLTLSRSK